LFVVPTLAKLETMARIIEFLTTRFHSVQIADGGDTLVVAGSNPNKELHVRGNDMDGFTVCAHTKGTWDGGEARSPSRRGLHQTLISMGGAQRHLD